MTQDKEVETQANRLVVALFGFLGTVAASFLPGLLICVIGTSVFGADPKLGVGGTIFVVAYVLAVFTAITVGTYLFALVPLFFVARVVKPSSSFWIAVLASLLAFPALFTFQPVVVAAAYLIAFSVLCLLYRNPMVLRRKSQNATQDAKSEGHA